MTSVEIRKQIDENNKIIADVMKPNQFILNSVVRDLLKANESLQAQCTHQYEDGYCIFCDKEE